MTRIVLLVAALVALSACSGYEGDEPVEAISQSETEALDDAAEMIDQRRPPDGSLRAEGNLPDAEDALSAGAQTPATDRPENGASE